MPIGETKADDPLWMTVNATMARYSVGRTMLYDLLGKELIEARKLGNKTLIYRPSADQHFASLPTFRKAS